ncbi:hypothetical protein KIPB_008891, partial [Kipferlia bialata]
VQPAEFRPEAPSKSGRRKGRGG